MRRIIDITPPLRAGSAVFPGDARYEARQTFAMGPGCPVNVAAFSMSVHCGAHADAPLHYAAGAASIDQLDLADYIGPARVIDVRGTAPLVQPEALAGRLEGVPPRVLLRLTDGLDPDVWPTGFPALAPESVELLARAGVRLIGVDVPSVDPETSKDLPSHMAVFRHDMRILENLDLSQVTEGEFELIALPIPLEGLDAAPVRAVLRPLA
ncbi:arylformamidase [Microvirga tunisiensis]|uniref:Kynurenine formamidase n=2 Tax=Pannonibacter tanglangensis TaxID=2750084 RepID=A0A7X5F3N2_9HYPH|nr:arylformamidase [Pannonibacter sp. XCT-34]NBN64603.1 arylformamidase [Pannonibacter sp. XCT-34]NBN79138.1 arylformamidase [Pannonibacter sp. XCT-53]